MDYKYIRSSVNNHCQEIAIDRPAVFNALNFEVLEELKAAFDQAAQAETVRCVVLTGGGGAFCSGQDLKAVGTD